MTKQPRPFCLLTLEDAQVEFAKAFCDLPGTYDEEVQDMYMYMDMRNYDPNHEGLLMVEEIADMLAVKDARCVAGKHDYSKNGYSFANGETAFEEYTCCRCRHHWSHVWY